MSTALDPSTRQQLQNILQRELELTQQILAHIQAERDAIGNQQSDQLTQIAFTKQQQLTDLQNTTQQREALLAHFKLPNSRAGMEQLIGLGNSAELNQSWQELTAAAEQCQQQNRELGMLIQREQNSLQQAQHILQRGTPKTTVSYNAAGSADANSKSRPLGKA